MFCPKMFLLSVRHFPDADDSGPYLRITATLMMSFLLLGPVPDDDYSVELSLQVPSLLTLSSNHFQIVGLVITA